jgi:carboxyl-terminal processing protease
VAIVGIASLGLLLDGAERKVLPLAKGVEAAALAARFEPPIPDDDGDLGDDGEYDHAMVIPSGAPTALGCDDARTIVEQARSGLAAPPGPVDPAKFAAATADWLDPHGLWSVAPDSPVGPLIRAHGAELLRELEAAPGTGPCRAAEAVGSELTHWSARIRGWFDEGSSSAAASGAPSLTEAFRVATAAPFEDDTITKSAHDLARELGHDAGELRAAYGTAIGPFVAAARDRTAPDLDAAAWARVVMAAALRAYVPQLDAHGAWAPLEEELSIYDLALETDPPTRLWTQMERTPVGIRVDLGAVPPLADGDVVVRIHDVAMAGVSVEQAEQLAVMDGARPEEPLAVTVLRAGAPAPLELEVTGTPSPPRVATDASSGLRADLVRYESGHAVVIAVPDVPDDLATRVGAVIDRARRAGDVRGVVLDLRQNGGGSTDGAIGTLGIFLPGATLFPMRRRDGSIEIERAPDVAPEHRWNGPLAVLVDSDSASAAEMLAGAIASYHRGTIIGDRTYGKGCAQEYLDDDAHLGVLRLTTLLYALPDGSPVQKVGITPSLHLTLPSSNEREALTARALGPWRGPDVRDASLVREVAWPPNGGHVGPCRDETVCRALRALGASPAAARR